MFVMQNAPMELLHLPGVSISGFGVPVQLTKFDLTLNLAEIALEFYAALDVRADLFGRETAKRMLERLSRLLESIVSRPGEHIFSLALLGRQERYQVLFGFNQTARE